MWYERTRRLSPSSLSYIWVGYPWAGMAWQCLLCCPLCGRRVADCGAACPSQSALAARSMSTIKALPAER